MTKGVKITIIREILQVFSLKHQKERTVAMPGGQFTQYKVCMEPK